MLETPLVSIIIPVYNGADYIKTAIESALAQTYSNVEVIVVNDGSADNGVTDAICKSYGNKIRYILKANGGVSSALNCGIENMRGKYFSWLSHDDLYAPDKIQKSIDILNKFDNPDRTIVICGTQYIDTENKPLSIIIHNTPSHANGIEMFNYCFLKKKSLNGSALLIPKQAFEECGVFSNLRFAQDMELWGRMMINGYNFVSFSYKGSLIRIHPNQATNRLRDVYFKERPILLNKLYDAINILENDENNKTKYLRVLLKSCYSTYPKPKDLIKKIEINIRINPYEKVRMTVKGIFVQKLKDIYHKFKYSEAKLFK